MLPRYFNAMVSRIKKNKELLSDDDAMRKMLCKNGFTKMDLAEDYTKAKARALEHIEKANANDGRLPVVVRIFDVKTDVEENLFHVDDFLKSSIPGWLRSKIIFAVNNGKAVEICAETD